MKELISIPTKMKSLDIVDASKQVSWLCSCLGTATIFFFVPDLKFPLGF